MGLYSFQQRFVPLVEHGTKTHTIRGKRKYPDAPGNTLYLYYAVRSPKLSRKLLEAPCVRVEDILIRPSTDTILLAGTRLKPDEMDLLAWRDGFRFSLKGAWWEMREYWRKLHPQIEEFYGDVIHWDYARRVMPKKRRAKR